MKGPRLQSPRPPDHRSPPPTGFIARYGGTLLLAFIAGVAAACEDDAPASPEQVDEAPRHGECAPVPASVTGEGPIVWDTPEEIPIEVSATLDDPRVVVGDDGTVAVAFRSLTFRDPDELMDRVFLVRKVGGRWTETEQPSDFTRRTQKPRIAIDAAGRVHFLWLEFEDTDEGRQDFLLHAIRSAGGWTPPDTVMAEIQPSLSVPWTPVADERGRLHLISEAASDPERRVFLYLGHWVWEEANGWSYTIVSEHHNPLHPEVIQGREGQLLATFIAADPTVIGRDRNSIFFVRSDDGGATWRGPHRIAPRSGLRAARRPRLAVASDERIHLVVHRDTSLATRSDVLEHIHSADGECWTEPEPIGLPGSGIAGQHALVTDDAGGVHVVFFLPEEGIGVTGNVYLRYTYWNGEEWSPPEILFDFSLVQRVDLFRDRRTGLVHMVASVVTGQEGVGRRILYTTGRFSAGE